ncbi:MAG TPA: hypothetical protein DIU15_07015 [Deltaproteobacteria bacterium]|nr:hypothetical protein [Deltaproteobacteria bacterium]HCP45773.1 hypothetical protein [Deltaproteobacteria bacterium]
MLTSSSLRDRQAAVGYAIYGVVYFSGAVLRLTDARKVDVGGGVPWWAFYVVGALLVVSLPPLIWTGRRWLCRLLALGVGGKALALSWRLGRQVSDAGGPDLYNAFFLVVAATAAVLLVRAGFPPSASAEQGPSGEDGNDPADGTNGFEDSGNASESNDIA